jgi:hypothetical protein
MAKIFYALYLFLLSGPTASCGATRCPDLRPDGSADGHGPGSEGDTVMELHEDNGDNNGSPDRHGDFPSGSPELDLAAESLPDAEEEEAPEAGVEVCGILEPESIHAETGFASIVSANFGFRGDTPDEPARSAMRLFEDGMELGPAHASLESIRSVGSGAFSHLGNALYFSSSDNTDPAANGRTYTFSGPCWHPVHIDPVFVADSTTNYATFQSHNQKVVENDYGIFLTYITSFPSSAWHLVRSTDGGATFHTVYENMHVTNAPAMETDEAGNIYLIHSQNHDLFGSPALFYRFDAASGFGLAATSQIPGGSSGKFTTFFDRLRDQIYLFTFWDYPTHNFFALSRSGSVLYSYALTSPGPNARIQYPHLRMDGYDLYAAWTNQGIYSSSPDYRSIHFMRSGDGGHNWHTVGGSSLRLPVVADDTGPATMISLYDEIYVNTWLSSFHVDAAGIHFMYYAYPPVDREHYVRFSKSTGTCDINLFPDWEAGDVSIASLDGFFASRPDGVLFAAAHDRENRIAIFLSDDGGRTWLDYAVSDPVEETYFPYSIGGCRRVTQSGRIMGTFTKQNTGGGMHQVWFFSADAGLWPPP